MLFDREWVPCCHPRRFNAINTRANQTTGVRGSEKSDMPLLKFNPISNFPDSDAAPLDKLESIRQSFLIDNDWSFADGLNRTPRLPRETPFLCFS